MKSAKDKIRYKYSVRVSPRAKKAWIKISPSRGLEVVIPRWFRKSRVPELIKKEERWIREAMKRLREEEKRAATAARQLNFLPPDKIILPAVNREYAIVYSNEKSSNRSLLREDGNERLILEGAYLRNGAWRFLLTAWLKEKAKECLVPLAKRIAARLEIPVNRVSVRNQKTIWGSCSPKKNLSLNCKLLLIPKDLARYVIIHELCHTRCMNHSRRFWSLVERYEPEYKKRNAELREAWKGLPRWILL